MRLGDYEVHGELGRGGMGVVYRAVHAPTGALRAVKVLAGTVDPELLARFRREAEALARVGGAGVVPVHEAGVDGGRLYVVLGLMPGGSLAARLEARGRFEWREAAALVAALARALERCHAAGIVHRDVKPANVLFDEEDRPRLADFGVARDLAAASLTETGTAIGTPAYMSPEQLEGEKVGPGADVYALGVLLHHLVAGELPFKARNPYELLLEKRAASPPPASAAAGTSVLDATIARALAANPAERTPSAAELARELEALLASGAAAPARSAERPASSGRRNALVAAAVLLVLVAGGFALVGRRRAPEEPAGTGATPGPGANTSPRSDPDEARYAAARARLAAPAPVTSEVAPFELVAATSSAAKSLRALAARRAIAYSLADVERLRSRFPGEEDAAVLWAIAALGADPPARVEAESILESVPEHAFERPLAGAARLADAVAAGKFAIDAPGSQDRVPNLAEYLRPLASAPPVSVDLAVGPITSAVLDNALGLDERKLMGDPLVRALGLPDPAAQETLFPPRLHRACVILVTSGPNVTDATRARALDEVAAEAGDARTSLAARAWAVAWHFAGWKWGVPHEGDACERDARECERLRPEGEAGRLLPHDAERRVARAERLNCWLRFNQGHGDRAALLARGTRLAREAVRDDPADGDAPGELLRFILEGGSSGLDEAVALAARVPAAVEASDGPVLALELERRRHASEELLARLDDAVRLAPSHHLHWSVRAVRALTLADLGRLAEARDALHEIPGPEQAPALLTSLTREAVERYIEEREKR